MRSKRIIETAAAPCVLASPLTVLLTERILAEWEVVCDAVLFPEERVKLACIVQATLDEQKNLVSRATGRKNDEMLRWWRVTAWVCGATAVGALIAWLGR